MAIVVAVPKRKKKSMDVFPSSVMFFIIQNYKLAKSKANK